MRGTRRKKFKQVLAVGVACVLTATGIFASGTNIFHGESRESGVVLAAEISNAVSDGSVGISTADAVKIDSLHNPISDVEHENIEYSYVYFGSYPQREVTGSALSDDVVHAQYVSGEAVVGQEKYYRYRTREGAYHYFQYEPIRWRVICKKGNEALLRSDLVLDCKAYSEPVTDYWSYSSLRSWLNSYDSTDRGFLNQAFTLDEIHAITAKKYMDFTVYGLYAIDKVHMLSGGDFYGQGNLRYPFELVTKASDYAFAKGVSGDLQSKCAKWWVKNRQSYDMKDRAGYVDENGVRYNGVSWENVTKKEYEAIVQNSKDIGVCPALVLDLTKTQFWCTQEEMEKGVSIQRGEYAEYIEVGMCGENASYRIENGTVYITGKGRMFDYEDDEYTPFKARPDIRKIVIEEGIESVGNYVFESAYAVEEVVLPQSLKEIGKYAFLHCSALKKINFPTELEKIGQSAFEKCTALEVAVLPDSLKQLERSVFYECSSLSIIKLPTDIEYISDYLCSFCDLKSIQIPDKVTSIGAGAFVGNKSLSEVTIPKGVTAIKSGAFAWDESLEFVTIPDTVTYMEDMVFKGTKWLENQQKKNPFVIVNKTLIDMSTCTGEAIIPEEVEVIVGDVTDGLDSITRLVIPATVTKIHESSFHPVWIGFDSKKICVERDSIAEQYLKEEEVEQFQIVKIQLTGDVDEKEGVQLQDAQLILKVALKIEELSWEKERLADTNEDGKVMLDDAQNALKAALKIVPWTKKSIIPVSTMQFEKGTDDSADNGQWMEIIPDSIQSVQFLNAMNQEQVAEEWQPFYEYTVDPDYVLIPTATHCIF